MAKRYHHLVGTNQAAWLLLREMTGNPVFTGNFAPFRYVFAASRLGDWAAGVERASWGRIRRTRDIPFEDHADAGRFDDRIGHWNRRQQSLGVGVLGVVIQIIDLGQFDDATQI